MGNTIDARYIVCKVCQRVEFGKNYWLETTAEGRERLQKEQKLKLGHCPNCIEKMERQELLNEGIVVSRPR